MKYDLLHGKFKTDRKVATSPEKSDGQENPKCEKRDKKAHNGQT